MLLGDHVNGGFIELRLKLVYRQGDDVLQILYNAGSEKYLLQLNFNLWT